MSLETRLLPNIKLLHNIKPSSLVKEDIKRSHRGNLPKHSCILMGEEQPWKSAVVPNKEV